MSADGPETVSERRKESLIGKAVDNGRYTIVKLIGEGGMGVVYQARQVSMDRMVAMKILRAQLAMDEKLLARFKQEALSVSRLRHPNTITVYDYGRTDDGLLFIAMELLGGRSLFDLLRREGPLPLSRTLHIMTQVCGAVAEAHKLGVVHRDLKPENIQIDSVGGDDDFAKVLDFGIAKIVHGDGDKETGKTLTMAGAIFGTPAYMSPEQVHGEKVDHRTDIYAMGIILYELLAGRQPFVGATPMAIMMAQASKPPPPLLETCPGADVNPEILAIIDRCLAKERETRFETADALLSALQQVQVELGDISRSRVQVRDSQWNAIGVKPRTTPLHSDPAFVNAPTIHPTEDPTPAAGHIATIPPPETEADDERLVVGAGKGRWIALVAVLLIGVGVAAFALRGDPQGDPVSPASQPASEAQPKTITYHLVSNPPGAKIFDGDLEIGVTPKQHTWEFGVRKQFRLELDGYEPATIEAAGVGGPVEERLVSLKAVAVSLAPMRIVSTPKGAKVTADGTEIGVTGNVALKWTPPAGKGAVQLVFTLDGYAPFTQRVDRQPSGHGPVDVRATLTAVPAPASAAPVTKAPKKPRVVKRPRTPKRPKTPKNPKTVKAPKNPRTVTNPKVAAPPSEAPKTDASIYKKL